MITAIDVDVASLPGTSIWDILTAIGTVGAVVIALVLGAIEVWSSNRRHRETIVRLERERDEARTAQRRAETRTRNEARRSQALAIPLWSTDRVRATKIDDLTGDVVESITDRVWTVENFSDAPVFGVVIRFYGANDEPHGDSRPRSVLKPGKALLEVEPRDSVPWKTAVFFRDIRSTQWKRTKDELESIDTD